MADNWDKWDKEEEKKKEEQSKGYFNIKEGVQQFVLLSHLEPLPQVFEGGKYRAAQDGDDPKKIKIRGVGWVLQDGLIKEAKLPYILVKGIRAIQQDPEWDFDIPFLHTFTLNAIGAGTMEVKYTLTPSPKKVTLSEEILAELKKKPSPQEIVERIKGRPATATKAPEYPEEDINPDEVPF